MTQLKKLLEPGLIGNVQIKNRVSMAPAERGYGNMDGSVTQKYIDYLVERAKNGVGMINVESTYIDWAGHGRLYQLGLYDDKLVPNHKRLTDALHKYGTKVTAEIQHAGRQTSAIVTGLQPVGPSAVPCVPSGGDLPRELTIGEIKEMIQKFAQAARRAKEAGYDMISIHGAHGYMIGAFASPYSNKRTDEYGGLLENRMRFPLEVYKAVRDAVGDDLPVGYRLSADEFVDGGLILDDTKRIAQLLEKAGVDFLDVSAGIYESAAMICAPMDMPLGYLVYLAAAIKEVVKIPVIATGRINDIVFAESILEKNQADFVHMVRAFHADPEILVKSQKGQADHICMCMGCLKCADLMMMHLPITCTVNPAAGREREFELKPAKIKKRVMVVGGGVAGMEAAQIACSRGHDVTLFEKDGDLGGQIRWASKGKCHEEFFQTARYRIHEVKRSGVKLELGKEVTLADVKAFKPDVVVIATGAVPFMPLIPGINKSIIATSFDILSGQREIGKRSLIIGGKREGLTVAEFLEEKGNQVIVVEVSNSLGSDWGPVRQLVVVSRIQENPMISIKLKTNVEQIDENGIILQSEGKVERITGIDSVVVAWNRAPANRLGDEVMADGQVPEIYRIGDAVIPRDAHDAIYEGAVIGRQI
jgi:2,4-dienoyl-CoA reductase-like NADH-dependent reductase (Old Yellow Enzyme family)/thioredoxin reductase